MKHFTSTATKDGRWWVVQCDQEPGALSQVARLDQAAEHQREAISMMTGIPEDEIEVDVAPALGEVVELALAIARGKRAEAERLQQEASIQIAQLAAMLVAEDGLSLRDTGFALGVSHQRVAQLVQFAREHEQLGRELVDVKVELPKAWVVPGVEQSDGAPPRAFATKSEAVAFARELVSRNSAGSEVAAKRGGGQLRSTTKRKKSADRTTRSATTGRLGKKD